MRILVIGESCKDVFMYGKCERLCPEATAPVFNPQFQVENGGMAKNVQKNILALGKKCDIYTNNNWEAVTKTRYIDHNFNYMFLRVDCNDKIERISDLDTVKYENYAAIIISDYNKGFLHTQDIDYIASRHKNVFLDTKKNIEEEWCTNVKYIKINNHEYEKTKFFLTENIKQKLIVTLGADGCCYRDKVYPVDKVEMKDSSGAGDTFISAFVIKHIAGSNIEESIKFANKCATEVVQKRGVAAVNTKE
jgi:D-beta-D-heptose 7-phosphate kinase/D-beta-D-heptose 1-phosphate adenosyltransferase